MRLVIFGLTVTSSWGNGHATIWRGLLRALAALGHEITFFERDVPYYASHRDLQEAPEYRIELYREWREIMPTAQSAVDNADAAVVTSYCVDALAATKLLKSSNVPVTVFYDLDTPVTLDRLRRGDNVEYIPPDGLRDFDLVLSYTGGRALDELRETLGARSVAALYGSVDPAIHQPVTPEARFRFDLSYLGTYASDRQPALQELFIEPARALPDKRFLLAGAKYPADFPWTRNIWFLQHVAPPDHPAFYSSCQLTLNITRAAMADMGFCPSGRLFEAAACGTAVVTDSWDGLDAFFEPTREILVVETAADIVEALSRPLSELRQIGEAARARALREHTARHRAQTFIDLLTAASPGRRSDRVASDHVAIAGRG
jgi:spore maturation protein CgeB